MKIRQGFVSNSSSSSFVILGAKITKSDAMKFIPRKDGETKDDYDERFYDEACDFSLKEGKTEISIIQNDSEYFIGLGCDVGEGEDIISNDPEQAARDVKAFMERYGINKKVKLIATQIMC